MVEKTIGQIVIAEMERYKKQNHDGRSALFTIAILQKIKWDMIVARMKENEKTEKDPII